MRKKNPRPYLLLVAAIMLLLSIPRFSVEKMHGRVVAVLGPVWSRFHKIKSKPAIAISEVEYQKLQVENQLLRNALEKMQTESECCPTLPFPMIAAEVIYRSPATWNSSLWINVGKSSSPEIIQKNSPVLLGNAVIGLIDYVGNHQSRVRLITDSGLAPSVRAKRSVDGKTKLLAKGELQGGSAPLWRSKKQTLKGIGFNYDFPDKEGPARDLRSGAAKGEDEAIPILEKGDLLVTTGMDGVFPPNLEVATVTEVQTLREGDYFYELEAEPVAGSLEELHLLFVIPPLGFEPSPQSPILAELDSSP